MAEFLELATQLALPPELASAPKAETRGAWYGQTSDAGLSIVPDADRRPDESRDVGRAGPWGAETLWTEAVAASQDVDVETLNDRLAREHPIDDYYARSPLPIRLIEKRRLQIIRDFVGPCDGLELAEIGSGGGHVLRMFRSAKLTAIDVSAVFLDTARKNLEGYDCRFVKGEVDKLDLPAESFDRIVCTEVLEHTRDPEAILATIARILKQDGVAVITVPNDPLIMRLKGVVRRTPVGWALGRRVNWGGDEYHLHQWTPRQFRRVLERHFRVTDYAASPHQALPIRACFRVRKA